MSRLWSSWDPGGSPTPENVRLVRERRWFRRFDFAAFDHSLDDILSYEDFDPVPRRARNS